MQDETLLEQHGLMREKEPVGLSPNSQGLHFDNDHRLGVAKKKVGQMTTIDEHVQGQGEGSSVELLETARLLHGNLQKVVLGLPETLLITTVAAISGAHLLLEDVPGVGKTVLAHAVAKSFGVSMTRIQGHPDLLPSDVTGVSIYSPEDRSWEFRHGPIFAHVVLVDELNRTPPRSQSALLEAMEEGQVTVDGRSWQLPHPHFVIATQNPSGQLGTFPLVESQLDRFALATPLGYPDEAIEARLTMDQGGREALGKIAPITSAKRWVELMRAVRKVLLAEPVAGYAVSVTRATRTAPGVRLGASPRASITLVKAAQAHAFLMQRTYVSPVDIQAMAVPALAHRLILENTTAHTTLTKSRELIQSILSSLPVPQPQ
jgi:MoxR-like ATPase